MNHASSPNSINSMKQLGIASYSRAKAPNGNAADIAAAPNTNDSLDVAPNAREIDDLSKRDLKSMNPQELLQLLHKVFQKFDLDKSGNVNADEAVKMGVTREQFASFDKDGNGSVGMREEFAPKMLHDLQTSGQISLEQCLSCMKELGGIGAVLKPVVSIFNRADADNDGMVTMREAQHMGVPEDQFKKWDQDGDGKVSFLGEYMPAAVNQLHEMGVLNDREHSKLMARIENAAGGSQGSDPTVDPQRAEPKRAERREERREEPIRLRDQFERRFLAGGLDARRFEDLAQRLFA